MTVKVADTTNCLKAQLDSTARRIGCELIDLEFKHSREWLQDINEIIERLTAIRDYHDRWQEAHFALMKSKPVSDFF